MSRQPLYPHVPRSKYGKTYLPSTVDNPPRQEVYTLRRVSIKRLYYRVPSADLQPLLQHAEGLWSDVVDLRERVESLKSRTTDIAVQNELADIAEQLRTVQSFAFNLTEY